MQEARGMEGVCIIVNLKPSNNAVCSLYITGYDSSEFRGVGIVILGEMQVDKLPRL